MEPIFQLANQALNNDSKIESGPGPHHLNAVAMSNTDHDELFGRQRELALLGSYLEAAAGGRSQVVLVVGEPGVGKTSLLDAIAAEALADSKLVLRGGASDAEGMPPYLPFLEAIGQYIRGANMHLLREQVGPAASIIASIFPELPLRLKDLPAGYSLPPEQARLRLYEAISAFLGAIAEERPLLLVLDDLHWADSSSLDLFCYIARHQRHSRFLILGAFQEGAAALSPGLERMVAELNHHRRLAMLPLGGLDQNAMNALAQNQLGPVDPEVGQVLYAQSEGNPFFCRRTPTYVVGHRRALP
jgi:predicted ATPase